MAEEIVGTIENVDRLFSEIIVNGESHVSERYVAPTPTETNHTTPSQSTPTQESESTESNPSPTVTQTQGEDVHAVELNHVLHDFSDPEVTSDVQTLQQGLADEVSTRSLADQSLDSAIAQEINARQSADNLLQGDISTLQGSVSTLQGKVSTIEGEIPPQASSQNQLADKNFVNSSIATNTANFLGTYTSLADIEAIPNPTNNDYAFLQTTDSAGNNLFDRYKYNADQEEWLYEYELNNSSFTAEQWATINSGLTQSVVTQEIADALASATIGHADEADKLSTARDLKVALGSNNAQSFDGTANATSIGVGGTLPVANGGTGQTDLANVTVGKAINGVMGRLGGAYGTSQTTIAGLIAEVTNANGGGGLCGGSISLAAADHNVPAGWHNFLYIPHRTGTGGGDNYKYGTLFLTPMTTNSESIYVIHHVSGSINNALRFRYDYVASAGTATTATQADYSRQGAYCTTAAGTAAKVADMRGFVLQDGATFPITFTNSNTSASALTLNVNSTGAKTIYINGSASSASNYTLPAGTYVCRYNGTSYYIETSFAVISARNAGNASTLLGQSIAAISRYESTTQNHQYIIRGSHSIVFFNYISLTFPASATRTYTFPVSFSDCATYVIKESLGSGISYNVSNTGIAITNSNTSTKSVTLKLIIEGNTA